MKKVASLSLLLFSFYITFAQQTVSIGSTTTKSNAVLWLNGNGSQALIIPIGNKDAVASPEKGMVIYNDGDSKIYFHNGTAWQALGGAGSAQTLSYDASTRQLTLSGTGGTVTITAQDLTKTGNSLSLSDDATAVSIANTAPTTAGQLLQWDAAASGWTSTSATTPANGQVLKWDDTAKRWAPSADNIGAAPTVDNISIDLNGSSQLEVKALGITDAKVATGISGLKINPNFGTQNIITTGSVSAASETLTGNLSAAGGTFSSGVSAQSFTTAGAISGASETLTGNLSAAGATFLNNVNIRALTYTWPAAHSAGVLSNNGTGTLSWAPAATGTVTSVGLSLPTIFSVTGSPVTTTGTLTATLASQALGTVFAAPAAAAGAPSFRTLVASDIPSLPIAKLTGAGASTRAILGSDNNTLSWVTGTPDQVLGTDAAGTLQFLDKSTLTFTNANYVPKGSTGGLVTSNIYDSGVGVGINNTSPTRPLDVDSNGGSYGLSHIDNTTGIRTSTYNGTLSGGGVGGAIGTESNHPFYIYVANSGEKATFLQNGNVGIGTNNPSVRLHVDGASGEIMRLSALSDPFMTFYKNGTYQGFIQAYQTDFYFGAVGTSTSAVLFTNAGRCLVSTATGLTGIFRTPTANRFEVEGNASKTVAGSWLANSDRRIKTSIHDVANGIETIKRLRPVTFRYTDEWRKRHPGIQDKVYYNFIAQEFQQVFPDAVQGSGEFLTGDSNEILQIDTYNAEIVTIKAVQELIAKIEKLEAENAHLKKDKDTTETRLTAEHEAIEKLRAEVSEIKRMLSLEAKK